MSMWVCPYCNKMQLNYEELQLENESCCFPRTCGNCWAEWLERYTLEYDCQELTEEWNLPNNSDNHATETRIWQW